MKEGRRPNLAASVRQRLLNRAKVRGEDFNYTLTQYSIERFLYRLTRSPHRDGFILKGATLFVLWGREPHRATWDVDLLGHEATVDEMAAVVRTICAEAVDDDGVTFVRESVQGEPIREGTRYHGVRVRFVALIDGARVPLQVDIGFGDAVVPAPRHEDYPTILQGSAFPIRAYARETVVAEKLEAMIVLGARNSRMKDFYDLKILATGFAFQGPELVSAIQATFARRGTPLPDGPPLALTPEFVNAPERAAQWRAFARRGRLADLGSLAEAVTAVGAFLFEPIEAARRSTPFTSTWPPGGPWQG